MKMRMLLLAMLLCSSLCMAGSISANGFNWDYEPFGEGVQITNISVAGDIFPNTTLTIPESLPEDGQYLNVVAISDGAIGEWGNDQWNNVVSIVLPKTLSHLTDWYGEESAHVYPLDWSLFETSQRTKPLTLVVQGPVLKNLYAAACWKESYNEEDGSYVYEEDGYFNLQLPTDAQYREQWEKMLTDELLVLSEGDDGTLWHELKVLDFKPNLDARVAKIMTALDQIKETTDSTGDKILEALKILVGLQQNPTLLQFAKDAGFITISNGVWTVADVTYEDLETQPNEVLEMLLSTGVLSKLESAINNLNGVSESWQNFVEIRPSDAIPLDETLYLDAMDAFVMKASLQGLLSTLHLLSSYNLKWDYTQPIEAPPLQMGQIDSNDSYESSSAWRSIPQKAFRDEISGATWYVQSANWDGHLIFRFVPAQGNVEWMADMQMGETTFISNSFWIWGTIHPLNDAILLIYENLAEDYASAKDYLEDEYFGLHGWSYTSDDFFNLWLVDSMGTQEFFESQPEMFNGRVATANLNGAKTYFKNACTTMRTALNILATRSTKERHLFNLSVEVSDEDLSLADKYLVDVLASLESATQFTVKDVTDTIYLAPLFTQQGPERKHSPKIINGEFVEETAVDPTYCGILPEHASQTDGSWIVTKMVAGDWTVTGHALPNTTNEIKLPETVSLANDLIVAPNKAGYRLFADNTKIKKVVIPSSYSVGVETFKNATSLKELIFDTPQVLEIGKGAFDGVALTHVTAASLPRGVDTENIEKWRVATGKTEIPSYYYYDTFNDYLPSLKHLILPASLTYIGYVNFGSTAPNLQTVTFEGKPPYVVDNGPFSSLSAVGYYPSLYADEWMAEIDGDGYWNDLFMETIKIAWNCTGGGSVTIMNGATSDGSTSPGEEITLKAIPDEGMVFIGWSGDVKGTANPITTTIQENMSTTAHFLPQALYLELLKNAGAGLEGPALESYIEAVIKERGLITEDQVYSMHAGIPLFKVTGGKVSIRLQLKSTNSLETWAPMDLSEAELQTDAETGALTITVPMPANEKAGFYKFVVPEKQ